MANLSVAQTRYLAPPFSAFVILTAILCGGTPEGKAQSPPEKSWSLEQGRDISTEQVNKPSLKLQGQQLSGTTGCNSFTATVSKTGERVKIVNLSLTRKLCAPRQNEAERAFVRALGQTEYLEKGTERLTFLSDKREPLLVWTSDKQDNARSL